MPHPGALDLRGKLEFADWFIPARDGVEAQRYAVSDEHTSPGERARTFLGAVVDPMLGRPVRDAEQFYQTYGRLMRWAWLSISLGIYDDEIQRIEDAARRLIAAQVHTVDTAWRPAMTRLAHQGQDALIVEVGTGQGNSIARLAQLFPRARIVSITVSPEQQEVVQGLVTRLGLKSVEVRLGDIFDPAVTSDLVRKADAVGAIEVALHFPHNQKTDGIQRMARLLKPGAPLSTLTNVRYVQLAGIAR